MKNLMLKLVAILLGASFALSPVVFADQSGIISTPACNAVKNTNNPSQPDSGTLPGCTPNSKSAAKGLEQPGGLAAQIVDILLFAAGTVSLIFVLIGGFQYITSSGDSSRIKGAKDTLLYAIIGLVVTALAFAISGFVISAVGG